MRTYLLNLFLLFSSWEALAFPWPETVSTEKAPESYQFYVNSQIMRFLNEPQFRYFVGGGMELKNPYFYIDSNYTYSITENQHYLRPKELYVKLDTVDGEWVIGRRRLAWNPVDSFWNRSLWEPAYRDDALRPQWAGLTGVFRDFHYNEGKATVFGSFLFIPEVAVPFESQNGQLLSDNPWFTPPPSKPIGKTAIDPHYLIHKPDWKSFLSLSLAGRAEYKNFHVAYAYKPMNNIRVKSQILLALDKELKGNHKDGYKVEVPVSPVLLHHHLFSGGFVFHSLPIEEGKQNISYNLKTSFTYNHPEMSNPEPITRDRTWVFFPPQREWFVSVKGELNVRDPVEQTTLHLAWTHHIPIEEKSHSALSQALPDIEKQFFRTGLFQFARTLSTGVQHRIKINPQYSANIKGRLIYNLWHGYFLFSAYSALRYNNSLSVFLSSDLLFSHFPFSATQTQQNIGVYTNKSRVFGGIKYVF